MQCNKIPLDAPIFFSTVGLALGDRCSYEWPKHDVSERFHPMDGFAAS
jgi:hypothetical protein